MNRDPVDVTLTAYLTELRARVEQRLLADTVFPPACPNRLAESIRYSLLAPGKRVRPCLVLMACEGCGGDPDQALPAASAIEMVHCYSLIHDDLPAMDDDDLRRGRPTNHIQFDESTAILAGDALLTLAFEVLARDLKPAELAAACVLELATAAGSCGMVGGQQADLEAESNPGITLAQLEAVHRRKTGQLLCAALRMGGRIGGADPQTLRSLTIYGESVGLAFQIADDLLDVLGEQDKMGKGVRKDADSGKQTYPSLLGVDESRRRASQLVEVACDAVAPLAERSHHLTAFARYIIERDH
ncbi:polyprenyl synthetase family protein [Planctomicrobium sp. SH661]|uniref:polyprenyl synthetase family protein n=1 Tax=Planctomicrobium sp. SH661 TaxID=3448124 RepID=UPI003F5BFAB4